MTTGLFLSCPRSFFLLGFLPFSFLAYGVIIEQASNGCLYLLHLLCRINLLPLFLLFLTSILESDKHLSRYDTLEVSLGEFHRQAANVPLAETFPKTRCSHERSAFTFHILPFAFAFRLVLTLG